MHYCVSTSNWVPDEGTGRPTDDDARHSFQIRLAASDSLGVATATGAGNRTDLERQSRFPVRHVH